MAWRIGWIGVSLISLVGSPAWAQVRTDSSLGRGPQSFTGRHVTLPHTVGRLDGRGRNLFHSFEAFNVGRRGSVTFTGPVGVRNVIARVTGGAPSMINGRLVSEVPEADLYLVNPAGVVFGAGANLDVEGCFTVTTADYIKFTDGKMFHASNPGRSLLTSAPPRAFGFLTPQKSGAIELKGRFVTDPNTFERSRAPILEVRKGKSIVIAGSDVRANRAELGASAGGIELLATRKSGEVELGRVGAQSAAESGIVSLSDAHLSVDGEGGGGGTILIRAGGDVAIKSSSVSSDGNGSSGGSVGVVAGGALTLHDSSISADTQGDQGGGVRVSAVGHVTLINSNLSAGALDQGIGGRVIVESGGVVSLGDSSIFAIGVGSDAPGGDVDVMAGESVILSNSGIASGTRGGGTATGFLGGGPGGTITVMADQSVTLVRSSMNPSGFGPSSGGQVRVSAGGSITLAASSDIGAGAAVSSGIPGGEVWLRAGGPVIVSGSSISVDGRGADGGVISISAGGPVTVIDSLILADVVGSGATGQIALTAGGPVTLSDGGVLSATNGGTGRGGSIVVRAPALIVSDGTADGILGTGIRTETTASVAGGRADMKLDLRYPAADAVGPPMVLRSPAGTAVGFESFSAESGHTTRADNPELEAGGRNPFAAFVNQPRQGLWTLEFDARSADAPFTFQAVSLSFGDRSFSAATPITVAGGDIVRVGIRVTSAGRVTGTSGQNVGGPAGTIDIHVGQLIMEGPGQISTASLGSGRGGNVNIDARKAVSLRRGATIASRAGGSDPAGSVRITAGTIDLRDATLAAEATAIGGSLTLHADGLISARHSTLTAKAGQRGARSAQITIDSPSAVGLNESLINGLIEGEVDVPVVIAAPGYFNVDSQILSDTQATPSPVDVTAAAAALRVTLGSPAVMTDVCGVRIRLGEASSFVVVGAGATSITPGGLVPSLELRPPGGTTQVDRDH